MATLCASFEISTLPAPVSFLDREDLDFFEELVPSSVLLPGYSQKGMHFEFPFGKMTFEFDNDNVIVYVTNLAGVKPEWRNKFKTMSERRVWNAFSMRRDEVVWRPHHAAPRDKREDVTEPRRGEWIIGSFSDIDFLWLESGDELRVDTGSKNLMIPVWKD